MYDINIKNQNLLIFGSKKVATLAGNLMLKKEHNEFPSDVFVILEAAGATLNIRMKTIFRRYKEIFNGINILQCQHQLHSRT
jgi:hypothetical protein